MKTLKILVLVVVFTFSNAISASTNPTEKSETVAVTETISELLKNPEIQFNTEMNAMVEFTINQNNEIVVLSVGTQNETFENFIKYRLNYKKIANDVVGDQKTFKIPVKITK